MELNKQRNVASGATMPRDEVNIEPYCRYGARVFVNHGGGVSIEQTTDYDGEARLAFDLDEAERVAAAILEVAAAARQAREEVACGNP